MIVINGDFMTFFFTNMTVFRIANISPRKGPIAGMNKPGTAKIGAISKAPNCKKGDPLGFVKLQFVANNEKIKGDPWKILKFGKSF